MIITIIPKEFISKVWPEAAIYVDRAWEAAPGYYNSTDILDRVLNDIEVLWCVYNDNKEMLGVFTTAIESYPRSRSLVISSLAGKDLEEWYADALDLVKRYAADQGCRRIEARGRGGWTAYAKKTGWNVAAHVYTLDLKD